MISRIVPVFLLAVLLPAGAPAPKDDPDTCLMLIADNLGKGGGNFYLYQLFSRRAVTFESGDVFEYEVFLLENLPEKKGGVDLWFEGGKPALRDVVHDGRRVRDRKGISAHGDGVLEPADGKWYARSTA